MIRSLKIYKEVGSRYMVMPDHVPTISDRNLVGVSFACCYGYIAAILEGMKAGHI